MVGLQVSMRVEVELAEHRVAGVVLAVFAVAVPQVTDSPGEAPVAHFGDLVYPLLGVDAHCVRLAAKKLGGLFADCGEEYRIAAADDVAIVDSADSAEPLARSDPGPAGCGAGSPPTKGNASR